MTTALDIITDSLYEARIYAPGEPISSADSTLALRVLNRMVDSWSNESLACFANLEQSGALQAGVSQYTIGTGGVFNMTRPLEVTMGPGAAYLQDFLGNNFPLEVVPQDKWNLIGNRTVTSQIPDTLFYDPQYPLGVMNVYPTPSVAYTMYWDSRLQLQEFPLLTTVLSLPLGYEDAFVHNLTLRLKPFFKAAQIDPLIIELASVTKAAIKRTNIKPVESAVDGELVARGSGTYNIYRDRSGGA